MHAYQFVQSLQIHGLPGSSALEFSGRILDWVCHFLFQILVQGSAKQYSATNPITLEFGMAHFGLRAPGVISVGRKDNYFERSGECS